MSSPAPAATRLQDANALPVGTRLGEFELRHVLGVGGFGIVYLAFDHALEREVAVKEYMPAALAGRTETMHVSLRSQSDAETFALGLRSFVNEARLLARFDHPALLKVLRFWEANGTAYMAMPVLRGQTLKEKRQAEGQAPTEAALRDMLLHLLGALERLHGEGVFHRDIAPDNIQIEPDGHPVLLDFGAARRVLSDKTQSLTAILKPAYAPIEQYAETGAVKQGPWTDIYALGATLHYVLLGKPPAPATARAVFDESAALARNGLPGFSAGFLQMVDWMLAPRPADRPQSAAELRQVLQGNRPVPAAFVVQASGSAWDTTQMLPRRPVEGYEATMVMAAPLVAGQLAAASADQEAADGGAKGAAGAAAPQVAPVSQRVASAAPARRAAWPWVAAVGAALALGGFVLWSQPVHRPTAQTAETAPASATEGASTAYPAAAVAPPLAAAAAAPGPAATTPGPAAVTAAPDAQAVAESVVKPVQPLSAKSAPPRAGAGTAPAAPGGGAGATGGLPQAAPAPAPATATAPVPAQVSRVAPSPATSSKPVAPAADTRPPSSAAGLQDPPAGPEATEPVAAGPEAKCAGRNALSHFICMERECLRSSFAGHADCKAWRKDAKRE